MTTVQADINFTDSAATKVFELIQEEDNADLMLRVYITGGGCSGFQYGFTFDEQINPDDQAIEKEVSIKTKSNHEEDDGDAGSGSISGNVTLLIDAMSYQYLVGADIDYREDIQGAQFVIRNPNAKTTCGCGSSFAV